MLWLLFYGGSAVLSVCVGLARTIYRRCLYGTFGREITEYTLIYAYIYMVMANPTYVQELAGCQDQILDSFRHKSQCS